MVRKSNDGRADRGQYPVHGRSQEKEINHYVRIESPTSVNRRSTAADRRVVACNQVVGCRLV